MGNFKIKLHFLLIALSTCVISAVEEDQPEIFLAPRHFNPHPYVATFNARGISPPTISGVNRRVGPVLFPPSPPDEEVNSNIIRVQQPSERKPLNHHIDNHPYSKVARKHKQLYGGNRRYQHEDNDINPRVYEALARHGAKVLSQPPSQLGKDYTLSSLSHLKKNYAFSYKVVDATTGDDFSHSQSQTPGATNGEYRVKLPDGRLQIVSYVADKNGYKADVKYTHEKATPPPIPKPPSVSYDYDYNINDNSHFVYSTATPAYDQPVYYNKVQPQVEIYTNNNQVINRYQNGGGFTTLAPYFYEHQDGREHLLVSSTPNYDQVYYGK